MLEPEGIIADGVINIHYLHCNLLQRDAYCEAMIVLPGMQQP